jgi:hypothetical protein
MPRMFSGQVFLQGWPNVQRRTEMGVLKAVRRLLGRVDRDDRVVQQETDEPTRVPDLYNAVATGSDAARVVELLEQGAKADATGWRGDSVLCGCAQDGKRDIAKILIAHGADTSFVGQQGKTPLHHAVRSGDIEMCALLVEGGANLDAKDQDGRTPLENAAFLGDVSICSLLLEHGADATSTNDFRQTPLDIADSRGHTEVVKLLGSASPAATGLKLLNDAYLVRHNPELDEAVSRGLDEVCATPNGFKTLLDRLLEGVRVVDGQVQLAGWGEMTWNELLKKREIVRCLQRANASEAAIRLEELLRAQCSYGQWNEIVRPALSEAVREIRASM